MSVMIEKIRARELYVEKEISASHKGVGFALLERSCWKLIE